MHYSDSKMTMKMFTGARMRAGTVEEDDRTPFTGLLTKLTNSCYYFCCLLKVHLRVRFKAPRPPEYWHSARRLVDDSIFSTITTYIELLRWVLLCWIALSECRGPERYYFAMHFYTLKLTRWLLKIALEGEIGAQMRFHRAGRFRLKSQRKSDV